MQVTEVTDSFSIESVVPFFQPIMDLNQDRVWSYECLARLISFDQQAYLPSEFLFLVERHDLVSELTQTIFNRSANYFRNINMAWSINVSLTDMADPQIGTFLTSHLRAYPNPKRVSIEVTAQNALSDIEQFKEFAAMCIKLGANIVIDHFDNTESDLASVLALPISAIKVSGRFFDRIEQENNSKQVIEQLISLTNQNKVLVIAEHIEQQSTLDIVKNLGIKYAQGFYFSQPKAST